MYRAAEQMVNFVVSHTCTFGSVFDSYHAFNY